MWYSRGAYSEETLDKTRGAESHIWAELIPLPSCHRFASPKYWHNVSWGDFIIPPPLDVAPSLYQVTRLTIVTRLAIQWRTIEPIICCAANTFDRRDWPHSIIHLICKLFTENKWDYLLMFLLVRLHISALHKFTYGKHILAKLENYYANNQQWFSRKKEWNSDWWKNIKKSGLKFMP